MVISFIKGVDLPEGKNKKKIGDDGSQDAVGLRNTIGASHRESMSRSGRALFRRCFGTTAAMTMCDVYCAGRAVGLKARRTL